MELQEPIPTPTSPHKLLVKSNGELRAFDSYTNYEEANLPQPCYEVIDSTNQRKFSYDITCTTTNREDNQKLALILIGRTLELAKLEQTRDKVVRVMFNTNADTTRRTRIIFPEIVCENARAARQFYVSVLAITGNKEQYDAFVTLLTDEFEITTETNETNETNLIGTIGFPTMIFDNIQQMEHSSNVRITETATDADDIPSSIDICSESDSDEDVEESSCHMKRIMHALFNEADSRDPNDYIYIGNNRDEKGQNVYGYYFPDDDLPQSRNTCLCGKKDLTWNYYIMNKINKKVLIVGSTCYKQFVPSGAFSCRKCGNFREDRSGSGLCPKCQPECNGCGNKLNKDGNCRKCNESYRICKYCYRIGTVPCIAKCGKLLCECISQDAHCYSCEANIGRKCIECVSSEVYCGNCFELGRCTECWKFSKTTVSRTCRNCSKIHKKKCDECALTKPYCFTCVQSFTCNICSKFDLKLTDNVCNICERPYGKKCNNCTLTRSYCYACEELLKCGICGGNSDIGQIKQCSHCKTRIGRCKQHQKYTLCKNCYVVASRKKPTLVCTTCKKEFKQNYPNTVHCGGCVAEYLRWQRTRKSGN